MEHEEISETNARYAFKESLDALEMFKQELLTNIPKINRDLETKIPNETETTSTAPEQNTTHTAQEAKAEQTSETIKKTTSGLTALATQGKSAIDNIKATGTRFINTTPYTG